MATAFGDTPSWFNAEFYLAGKLAQLIAAEPAANWTRESMVKAFEEAGYSNPYDHYVQHGDSEGLSPNPLFNNAEYLAAKTAAMGTSWTQEMVAKAIKDSGMTLMQHYDAYGSTEGINPSSAFNQDKYYDAKLDQLQRTEPTVGWTLEKLKAAFAEAGMTPLDHYLAYAKAEELDKFDYSENGAPIPHPGNTKIVLTKGADTVAPDAKDPAFQSTDRDDVIFAKTGSTSTATLNPADVIDGGKGQDTLSVDMAGGAFGGFDKGGSMKNVETVFLTNANAAFDAKNITDVNVYVVNGGDKGGATIKNVNSTATGFAVEQASGNFTVQFADAAISGKTDVAHVTLNTVGSEDADVGLTVKGMGNTSKVENLNLYSQGKGNYVDLKGSHEGVTVMGAADLDVLVVGAGLKSFDASAATGDVTADLTAATTTLKTIKGGAGDDTITVANAELSGMTFDGGDGQDKLIFTGTLAATSKPVISGFEKIQLNAASTLNGTNVTGVQEIVLNNVASNNVAFTIDKLDTTDLTLSLAASNSGSVSYNGKGELTVQSVDLAEGNADNTAAELVANSVETLHIVNNDHAGTAGLLTIDTLEAKSATAMTVDTGEGGVTLDSGSHILNSVTTLAVTGEGDFTDIGSGSFAKLTEVNAAELKGDFTYTLRGTPSNEDGLSIFGSATGDNTVTGTIAAEHVKFTGGNGTNLFDAGATGGRDVLELGDGSYTVESAQDAANKADSGSYVTVKGFDSDDTVAFGGNNDAMAYSGAKNSVAGNSVTGIKGTVASWEELADSFFASSLGLEAGKALTTGGVVYFAIESSGSTGVYAVKVTAAVNLGSAVDSGSLGNIDLVAVLEDTTLDAFGASSFIL